jgi:hypothetical protein
MRRATLLLPLMLACSWARPPPPGPSELPAWTAARARWSRSAKLYDRFETHAFLSAAYQSPELRRGRVDQVADWRKMTAAEKAAALEAEAAEERRAEDFLVALYTVDPRDNDLDLKQSIWRVALVVPGEGEALPTEVKAVRTDAQLRELYPFIGEFHSMYRVRFAPWKAGPLASRPFLLRVAGAEGQMDLDYAALPAAAGR